VLVASCLRPGCGAEAAVGDIRSLAFRGASIERLEDQVRCACGARRGRLSTCQVYSRQPASEGSIYLFGL
jgi:hypothetical protein